MATAQSTKLNRFYKGLPRTSGIYAIVHVPSGRHYVGQTVDFRDRLPGHVRQLRKDRHETPYLQHAFNKYGEAEFAIKILEVCLNEEVILCAREQYWIDRYKGRLFNARALAEQFSREWHRSADGERFHRIHAAHLRRWWEERPMVEYACQRCNLPFLSRSMNTPRYCSNKCRILAKRDESPTETRTCSRCGRPFVAPTISDARLCLGGCRNHRKPTVTEDGLIEAIRRVVSGESVKDVAAATKISASTILGVIHGERRQGLILPADLQAAIEEHGSVDAGRARVGRGRSAYWARLKAETPSRYICEHCGAAFEKVSLRRTIRFCSPRCSQAAWHKAHPPNER